MHRIALIGMPGSGKSTIGRALAEHLGVPFVDLDQFIERTEAATIATIFGQRGEPGFRALEADALERVFTQFEHGGVCSTGGGVVVTEANRERLKAHWTTIYLRASIDTLACRLHTEQAHRPLLADDGHALVERLRSLYNARAHWYAMVASRLVSVDGRSIAEIVEDIVDVLEQRIEP